MVFLSALMSAYMMTLASSSNVKYVNPMQGTAKDPRINAVEYGGMIPSTGTPFGMTRWTPMTAQNLIGTCPYLYSDTTFHGFLATHQPAVWMGESAEFAVTPGMGSVKTTFEDRSLKYSHVGEVSTPQYFKTVLKTQEDTSIVAELTATSRTGTMRFTFDSDVELPFVTFEATREGNVGEIFIDIENNEIRGTNPERQDSVTGPFKASDFKGYFVARFDRSLKSASSYGTSLSGVLFPDTLENTGESLAAYVQFESDVRVLNVQVGVSYISYEQARQNLENELGDAATLEETASSVEALWAEKLDLIQLTNATDDQLSIFYTSMYHALQYPNEMMEHNASGTFYYSGFDNAVHQGDHAYTGYSLWDTYRSEWAFINLFAPERVDGMIQSMLHGFVEGGVEGRLPIWQNIVETNIMIGTHSSSLIAESLAKGFTDFDFDIAWRALWKDAMVPPQDDTTTMYYDRQPNTSCEARAGLTKEKELGYVAAIQTSEAGSRTLEYAYDDYTVAVAAKALGHEEHAAFFMERSRNYRNIFNNETLLMEARFENGTWCDNPTTWTEADAWIYTFNVQHDFPGLRSLFHGAEAFGKKLTEYYDGGHDDFTNEPSQHTSFGFLYANMPDQTQSKIRSIIANNYFNNPVGLSGNDDCGQMASWYIFNTIGFYPVNPASGEYLVGSPGVDEVLIKFPLPPSKKSDKQTHHTLKVSAKDALSKPYVRGMSVDGVEQSVPVLKHDDLFHTQEINFDMSREPETWGANVL